MKDFREREIRVGDKGVYVPSRADLIYDIEVIGFQDGGVIVEIENDWTTVSPAYIVILNDEEMDDEF